VLKKATIILSSGNDDDDNVIGMMDQHGTNAMLTKKNARKMRWISEVECKFENLNIRFDRYINRRYTIPYIVRYSK
jgi:hypothetical protein